VVLIRGIVAHPGEHVDVVADIAETGYHIHLPDVFGHFHLVKSLLDFFILRLVELATNHLSLVVDAGILYRINLVANHLPLVAKAVFFSLLMLIRIRAVTVERFVAHNLLGLLGASLLLLHDRIPATGIVLLPPADTCDGVRLGGKHIVFVL